METKPKLTRKIIHVDMDAFFASVEQRDNPDLMGKCVIVGGLPNSRGVVCAASYEARRYGIRSAMASSKAYTLCPQGVFIQPQFAKYKEVSIKLKQIFSDYTDLIEPLSLDEAYLDVTENKKNIPLASRIAKEIKYRIQNELNLIASCGIASNKLLAKIASDYKKPNGFFVIQPHEGYDFMNQLDISKVPGVGKATYKKLKEMNINLCGDLLKLPKVQIIKIFGKWGERLYQYAQGIDDRPVKPFRLSKSAGSEKTLSHDTVDMDEILSILENEVNILTNRLKQKKLSGKSITLKIKYHDFTTITRSQTLTKATDQANVILTKSIELLNKTMAGKKKIRLVGVSVSKFTRQEEPSHQLLLDFSNDI